jgi:hexosaminidase
VLEAWTLPPLDALDRLTPAPVARERRAGTVVLPANFRITAPRGAATAARLLREVSTGDAQEAAPNVTLAWAKGLGDEGYRLGIDARGVKIEATRPAGLFYGAQSLRQMLGGSLPHATLVDRPRFAWRGAMLDLGRYYLPLPWIRTFIDTMALYKLNTLHLHLTEDAGWRMEIKRYPKLTEIGAFRERSMLRYPDLFDTTPHGGFYTQKELRELVAYARERHVTLVPEIDMPGHTQAAIAAYPELGNLTEKLPVRVEWGVNENVLNGEASTVRFFQNVLAEVIAVFPGKFVHVGGDEVPKKQWKESPRAQALMRERGLRNEEELQGWFLRQMDRFLASKGRRMIGWDEILEGGLTPGAAVMAWRGTERGFQAAKLGHDVVMAPTEYTYFDYYQSQDTAAEPHAIGGYLPLRKVYAFDPVAGIPAEFQSRVLGGQGQIWGEYISTGARAEYMAFPRLIALAEVLWSPARHRTYDDFLARWPAQQALLDARSVNFRRGYP